MLQTSPFSFQLYNKNQLITTHDISGDVLFNDVIVSILSLPSGKRIGCSGTVYQIQELQMSGNGGVGSACWLSAVAFCSMMRKLSNLWKDKIVLELGSGVGLGGIAISKTDAAFVVLTDNDKELEKVIKSNIIGNNSSNNTNFSHLDWNDCERESYIGKNADIIVALDCIYFQNRSILKTAILKNLKMFGTAILINPQRDGLSEFIYMMMEHGTVELKDIDVKYGENQMQLKYIQFTNST